MLHYLAKPSTIRRMSIQKGEKALRETTLSQTKHLENNHQANNQMI